MNRIGLRRDVFEVDATFNVAGRTSAVIHALVKRCHVVPQSFYCEALERRLYNQRVLWFMNEKKEKQPLGIHTFNVQNQASGSHDGVILAAQ